MRKNSKYRDGQLLKCFREGDEVSFEFLFNSFFPALCYYAFRITRDQAAAEDAASESFIKIWDRREMFQEIKMLKSYLYSTVRNASLQWLRTEKRQSLCEMEKGILDSDTERDAFEHLIHAEFLREVYFLLDKLPLQCKRVVDKLYVEGKSVRQTAEELEIAIGTVKSHKAKALIIFRKKLQI